MTLIIRESSPRARSGTAASGLQSASARMNHWPCG